MNLQKTPKDRRAALVLRARADRVMAALMAALALQARPLPGRALDTGIENEGLRHKSQTASWLRSWPCSPCRRALLDGNASFGSSAPVYIKFEHTPALGPAGMTGSVTEQLRLWCSASILRVEHPPSALQIPHYVRDDVVAVHVRRTALRGARQACTVTLAVCSVHGAKCPLLMLAAVEVDLPVRGVAYFAIPH